MSLLNFDPQNDRIRLAERRLADAYARKSRHEVPIVEAGVRAPLPPEVSLQDLGDLDRMLYHAAAWANGMASCDSDWPPFIDTLCGVVLAAEAFGCKVVYGEGGVAWATPAITDIHQAYSLKPLKPSESPMNRRLMDWVDYSQRKLGTHVPLWTMDMQSPFSVAAHVIDSTELMTACITDPKPVHHLLQMITDYSIKIQRQHIRQMEHPCFPGRNFPSISEDIGICIADDTPLILLSPEMYREFALPYNSQIGSAFKGVHVHSCGDYHHNLDNLMETTNIRSIQVHAGTGEFPLPLTADEDCAFNRARKKLAYLVDANDVTRGDAYRGRHQEQYRDYVLPRLREGDMTGCILQSCGPASPDADAAVRWTRQQLS